MDVDLRKIDTQQAYKLMSGSVVPRPIAWVSSMDTEGELNLAPFSFFTVASRNPPMLCISIGPGVGERLGTVKDTLENIRQHKQYVINIVNTDLANEMHESAKNFPKEVDEFAAAGVTPVASTSVSVPRVGEAPISFELELDRIIELGSDHLILGRVVHYHIKDEYYLGNYKVDLDKLKPLGRIAHQYSEMHGFFSLPREK
ncbi:flavin reductase family protein [Planococcus sp. 107-1]|uniref:flavin reductase family protein n=1 Tax=Planococcus sp. 107-1 TaxID=2908840 RepID=UPI001F1A2BA8|nr:flavin reductase family protein [Planococcus sp. 107-1]UJF26701.1 flavin reductase family protein [Planococcus sp. 107-1]